MGEAKRRKAVRALPDEADKIERQSAAGVIVLTFSVESMPTLHCVLPIQNAVNRLAEFEPMFRAMSYQNIMQAMRSELSHSNHHQGDQASINAASVLAIYAALHNPTFGHEVRDLFAEVRRRRNSLGLGVFYQQGKWAFGINTGIANVAMSMIGKPQAQEKFRPSGEMASEAWRTRVDQEYTADYGVQEVHLVVFGPKADRPGLNHAVTISVPETPPLEIRHALEVAIKAEARVTFTCDTPEQAQTMSAYAEARLPGHCRVSYERAEAGAWGGLS